MQMEPLAVKVVRETKETQISLEIQYPSHEASVVNTGVDFFDHMLHQAAFHGHFSLNLQATGDLHIDDHHLVEDIGHTLGQAVRGLVESRSIRRYASNATVMDDAFILCGLDISGRPYLGYQVTFTRENLGQLSLENVREFFTAFTNTGRVTLHFKQEAGFNNHHICEAMFKAFGRALREALETDSRPGVASTKGIL